MVRVDSDGQGPRRPLSSRAVVGSDSQEPKVAGAGMRLHREFGGVLGVDVDIVFLRPSDPQRTVGSSSRLRCTGVFDYIDILFMSIEYTHG